MKTLNRESFEEICRWIYRNARPLELELWRYHFEKGSKEAILHILSYYQNTDGGFGNAIDPDSWNPYSSPYSVHYVIRILRQINFLDTTHPVYKGIFRYLENTEHKAGYGWFFTVPSNNDYPHAVWWDYDAQKNVYQSIGITASLSGFILRYGDKQSNLYKMATEYAKNLIENLSITTNFGDIGIEGYCMLLEDIEGAGLTDVFNFQHFCEMMHGLVRNKIDTNDFMANPLNYVLSPNSRFYEENKREVEIVLDQIIDLRPASSVWNIPWEWYNGNKYPEAFAISINWGKSIYAIEKLMQLKKFGRLSL